MATNTSSSRNALQAWLAISMDPQLGHEYCLVTESSRSQLVTNRKRFQKIKVCLCLSGPSPRARSGGVGANEDRSTSQDGAPTLHRDEGEPIIEETARPDHTGLRTGYLLDNTERWEDSADGKEIVIRIKFTCICLVRVCLQYRDLRFI